jgi:hypothetical protein
LNRALPTLLRQPWRAPEETETAVAQTDGPEALAGETDDPSSTLKREDLEALSRHSAIRWISGVGSGPAASDEEGPDMFDERPRRSDPNFFARYSFPDLSVLRVTLGYGVPAILSIGLATLCFCRRDL